MNPNHVHEFDPISGWCTTAVQGDATFCGHRDDGRQIMPFSGEVIREGPKYTREMLTVIKTRIDILLKAKYPNYRNKKQPIDLSSPAYREVEQHREAS